MPEAIHHIIEKYDQISFAILGTGDKWVEQALKEFMNPQGEFFRGELYIFAYDFDGNVISHGAKPALVGKNLLRLKDAKGLSVIEELRNIAGGGQGWLRYYWDNPVEKKVMPKMGYVVKVDDSWWLGSGMYEEE